MYEDRFYHTAHRNTAYPCALRKHTAHTSHGRFFSPLLLVVPLLHPVPYTRFTSTQSSFLTAASAASVCPTESYPCVGGGQGGRERRVEGERERVHVRETKRQQGRTHEHTKYDNTTTPRHQIPPLVKATHIAGRPRAVVVVAAAGAA